MLHFLNEGGNAELKHRFFPLGINIRKHLQRTLNNYNGDKDVDGYKRLVNILSMENGIAYNEMKRIKNFFDNFQGSQDSIEFILNGGQPMMLWVNATLNRATQTIKDFKAAKKAAGIKNAYIRPHEKDRQNKTKEPTTAKFQTKNAAKDIDSNNAIKYESKNHKQQLTESQEAKSISAAKKLVMNKFGWDNERADRFVRIELRNDLPVLRTRQGGKFIYGVTRMYCDNQLTDSGTIMSLNRTLELVASDAHINEYDRNLNGMSAEELIERFAGARQEMGNKDREEVGALEIQENNDYTIVQIDDFEQAKRYGQYTDWCVTHDEYMLDNYTTGGMGQFYFCLKNGFENVSRERGEGCPLDEYGLSMIAVNVDENGDLNTCTCRWNHDNGGNDHIMDTKQISQLVGRNFYDLFKPNNTWKTLVDDAMNELESGAGNESDVFDNVSEHDGFYIVSLKEKWNILRNKKLVSPNKWYDEIKYLGNDLFFVRTEMGGNVINGNGNGEFLIPNRWFNWIQPFSCGYACLSEKGMFHNYIDQNCNFLFPKYSQLLWASSFENDVAIVRHKNEGYSIIDTNGNFIKSFSTDYHVGPFKEGFAIISEYKEGRKNFINTKGELLSPNEWFLETGPVCDGLGLVQNSEGKWNLLKKDGSTVFSKWRGTHEMPIRMTDGHWHIRINSGFKRVNNDGEMAESVKSKRTITITEEQYRQLLSESQVSKSISAAKKLVMDRLGYDNEQADEFIRVKLRGDLPALRTDNGGKFILGVTRMFCDRQLTDGGIIMNLNRTIELIASDAHINEYDRNLNGMSAQELIDRFSGARKEIGDKDREEVGALELQENNDYTILQIDNFEQSKKYGQYTSWCVTHNENMLDSYTSGGIGQFYFCLKNGFENVPRQRGDGCPLDEYGLSMVAVSVDEDGALNTCTCRWNHDCGGNDNIMDTKQISQLIGKNFYEVFKPNNKWKNALENAMQRLDNGERPQEIFKNAFSKENGFIIVEMSKKRNVCAYDESSKKYRLLSPNLWFDETYYVEQNKMFEVSKNRKWNWLKEDGTLLSPNLWFDNITDFVENGLSIVALNNKLNILSINGEILCDNWYDDISSYHDNLARVNINQKCGFINKNGKLAFNKWFISASNFNNGFAIVDLDNGYNIIDTNGNFVSKQCFDFCDAMIEGFARVRVKEKWNYIDTNGNMLSKQWFDFAENFKEGLGHVQNEEKENFIKADSSLISDRWYKSMSTFSEGFSVVEERVNNIGPNKYNYIDTNGKLLSETWFDWCSDFEGGLSFVEMLFEDQQFTLKNCIKTDGTLVSPNKWFTYIERYNLKYLKVTAYVNDKRLQNLLDIETGEILCDEWFDDIFFTCNGFTKVFKESLGFNFINTDGDIISDEWFYDASNFVNGFARIWRRSYDSNYINTNGKIISPNLWFDESYDFDNNGFGRVHYNNRYNLIDGNGKFVSDQGFAYIAPSGDLYVGTSLDGKCVSFNPKDKTISPMKKKNRFEAKQRNKFVIITEEQYKQILTDKQSFIQFKI